MVSVFEVWLKDENRTVFVNVGEDLITTTTLNHVCSDVAIDDYDAITVDCVSYTEPDISSKYFKLYRDCLLEYLKKDCKYMGYSQLIPFNWLPDAVKQFIAADSRNYTDSDCGESTCDFETDGYKVCIIADNGDRRELTVDYKPQTLADTLKSALVVCSEKLMVDREVMDEEDLTKLLMTIESLKYHIAK